MLCKGRARGETWPWPPDVQYSKQQDETKKNASEAESWRGAQGLLHKYSEEQQVVQGKGSLIGSVDLFVETRQVVCDSAPFSFLLEDI